MLCCDSFSLQERVALKYQDDIKLSAMITVCGTIQVALIGVFMEREVSAWKLKLNWSGSLELLAILYGVRLLSTLIAKLLDILKPC